MLLEKQKTMSQDTFPLECTAELRTVLPIAFDVPLVTCVALPIVVTTPLSPPFAPVEAAVHNKQDSVLGTDGSINGRLTGKLLLFEYAEWYAIFIMPGSLRMMSISFLQLFVGICQLVFCWVSLLKKRSTVT
jgi:hypothetical protein